MMNKNIKRIIWLVVLVIVAWQSVYFKKLSDVKSTGKKFDATTYAQDMLTNKLPGVMSKVISVDQLIAEINADKIKAFSEYGHSLAIGSTRYFMVGGSGFVKEVDESRVVVITYDHNEVSIATEFVFGNAVRDASGLIDLNDFTNTIDLNNISAELNKTIREKVLPPFKKSLKKGDNITFNGAIELNQEHLNLKDIEIIPVILSFNY